MGRIIAIANQKGGVGKTTTAINLSASLAEKGRKVLAIDMDPQGNMSSGLGLDKNAIDGTIYDMIIGENDIEEVIDRGTIENLDILPSNVDLSAVEIELIDVENKEFIVKNSIQKVRDNYDFVIIDTPPALNILTVNAYVAADSLIIPMAPEILSLLGISQIRETIETVRRCYNPNLKVLGILLNKFNPRLNLNREVLDLSEQIASQLDSRVFNAKIRASVAVAEAPAYGESVLSYAPDSKVARDFRLLINEIARMYEPNLPNS